MKLKFRADSEDLLIFGMFAVFLLYIVAIGVVNIHTFATEGHLSGLNPFPAFEPRYLFSTLFLYFLFLLGLFASVSSMFFEREKGFGITTDKKDKGYSRWAKEKEIKNFMDSLGISREEAEQLWKDDHSDCLTEEQAELEKKAKNIKRYEQAEKKPRKPREVKLDEIKIDIIKTIFDAINFENKAIKNPQKEITFTMDGSEYSLSLIKHRPPKA